MREKKTERVRGGSSEWGEGGIKKSEEQRQSRAEVKEGKMK